MSTFVLALAHLLHIVPSPKDAELRRKAVICEFLAITSSLLVQYEHAEVLDEHVTAIAARYPDIRSGCIRRHDGVVLLEFGDHQRYWHLSPDAHSTRDNVSVPITCGSRPWGKVELTFTRTSGIIGALAEHPLIVLGIFMVCMNGLLFQLYLSRAFNYLDPTRTVPMHVRTTLDTFSEGVVVLDNERRIVLTNDKFRQQIGRSNQELLGHDIDKFPWLFDGDSPVPCWRMDEGQAHNMRIGMQLNSERRTYLVSASSILSSNGQRKGTIASFDDITQLEQKRDELSRMLKELQLSRDELALRNKELQFLATRDPLTGCLNRRTFYEFFNKHWEAAQRHGTPLCCFMVDVDRFKSVNDNFGHSVGDEVLRRVAATIQMVARDTDLVCRYGGEEFCVLLPQTNIDAGCELADELRRAIEQLRFTNLSVTASFGVSAISLNAIAPQELLDQADKCLYAAKRTGRNRVVRWDAMPADVPTKHVSRHEATNSVETVTSIPYPAVASLVSALAFRDAGTAAHSTRVAELCVATAGGLMSVQETYVLEVAALLHDIGKIGVPDAILLKPGPLTREEWKSMELHDRIGMEIVKASFANSDLVDIMRYHHASYGGSPDMPHVPKGEDIPLGARIITIADAYDAMVSDRVYRKGRPPAEAFQELRRCAGRQFDPELVERFIAVVTNHKPIALPVNCKQSAMRVGLQIERLARAIDDGNRAEIKALASQLHVSATDGGIREIAELAEVVKDAADDDSVPLQMLEMVDQLLALCRSAQKVYTDTTIGSSSSLDGPPS